MKRFGQTSIFLAIAAFAAALPAFGSITYTCDATINADSGVNACGTLQTTIAGLYSSTFTNANASIYVRFAANGSGTGLGGSNQFISGFSYASYRSALASHEGDANDVTAVGSLPGTDPLASGGNILLTTALANALGLADTAGTTVAGAGCTIGSAGCYNGIITLNDPTDLASQTGGQGYYYRSGSQTGSQYDFFSVVEHETDEILGTISCLTTVAGPAPGNNCGTGNGAATDLFRYASAGTRTFLSTANGTAAYFSIDGGTTHIANYNNSPNGQDYGDWSTNCQHIQDATACLGSSLDITNDTNLAEIKVLDAVGYNLASQATPEPATVGLIGASLVGLVFVRLRRR